MSRLVPTSTTTIPVSQATEGYDVAKLVVEKHEFPAPQQPAREKIAFLWSHANGFNKEVMHPLMRRFLAQLRKLEQYNHTDVHFIAWDARNHGDSARLNEGHHTPKFSWFDHAMDTKQIIDELDLKSYDKLIGVGHSFGATSMILCEFLYPKTFDGLTILEPVIHGELPPLALRLQFPAIAVTLKRRDTWDSREECMKSLAGRSFWKAFHHEVLENYVQYGLYHTADGKVKLKCPKEQEHLVYMNGAYGAVTAFAALRTITIPLHFVHANFSGYVDPKFGETIKKQSPLITNAYVDGTHVVPLENPDILVPEIIRLTERVREQGVRAKL